MDTRTGDRDGDLGLRWRALTRDDVPAWSAFTRAIADADGHEECFAAEDLAEQLDLPGRDVSRDTVTAWDGHRLAAVGEIYPMRAGRDGVVAVMFTGRVHPDFRARGIGTRLLSRLEARIPDAVAEQHPGRPFWLHTDAWDGAADAQEFLCAHGYRPVRHFHEMTRPLGDLPATTPVDGLDLVGYDSAHSEPVRLAHLVAFDGHWGSAPLSEDVWASSVGSRALRPECSVVVRHDGQVVGYAIGFRYRDRLLEVGMVGVLPAYRGRGIARWMLAEVLRRAAGHGFENSNLWVDSENEQGAGSVYASVGYTVRHTAIQYRKDP